MTDNVGVLLIGVNGSIATTVTTGVFAIRSGLSDEHCLISELPAFAHMALPPLGSLSFSGWDLRPRQSHLDAAVEGAEVSPAIVQSQRDALAAVIVNPGISLGVSTAVREITDPGLEMDIHRVDAVKRIESDISSFIQQNALDGAIVVNLASTEPPTLPRNWQASIEAFETALAANEREITAGMIYAYAAIRAGCPIINYTPNDMFEIPALIELSHQCGVPLAGRDGKTGQTFYKSVLAPAFNARALNVTGWFSTNILGNQDGVTLSHAANLAGKIRSKLASIDTLLAGEVDHQVHINHYAPRKHQKEAWDSVDIRGWLGAQIQMKINWIAPDSALAAPMIVDLVRFLWWANKTKRVGIQSFLAPFFKDPLDCSVSGFTEQFERMLAATKLSSN